MNTAKCVLIAALLSCPRFALPQSYASAPEPEEKEPAAVLELGGAGSWSLENADSSFGPTVAVEVTPIEDWLELEAGVTALFRAHTTEIDLDSLFKKPWTLSPKAELMAGLGPEWIHTHVSSVTSNAVAGEAVLDFMYWPSKRRRLGWYLEPAFDYSFAGGHEKSIGINGGLLIAIP